MSMECFSIYLCPLLFPSAVICSSPWRGPLYPLLVVFLGILFLLKQLWMAVRSWFGSLCVYYWCVGMLVISAHWFCILRLCWSCWRKFWGEMMGFSKYIIMLSANRENLTSCFPNWILFISFSCPIALARTSNTMLNSSAEKSPLSSARFQRECLQVLPIQYDIGCWFVINSFYYFEIRSINTEFIEGF